MLISPVGDRMKEAQANLKARLHVEVS